MRLVLTISLGKIFPIYERGFGRWNPMKILETFSWKFAVHVRLASLRGKWSPANSNCMLTSKSCNFWSFLLEVRSLRMPLLCWTKVCSKLAAFAYSTIQPLHAFVHPTCIQKEQCHTSFISSPSTPKFVLIVSIPYRFRNWVKSMADEVAVYVR